MQELGTILEIPNEQGRVSIRLIIDESIVKKYHEYDKKHASVYRRAKHTASQKRMYVLRPLPVSLNDWAGMGKYASILIGRWHKFIIWMIRTQYSSYIDINLTNAYVGFTFVKTKNVRFDVDNLIPKHIIDGMVQAGVFIDDNWNHIRCVSLAGYVDSTVEGKKRGEFTEIIVEGEPTDMSKSNGFT